MATLKSEDFLKLTAGLSHASKNISNLCDKDTKYLVMLGMFTVSLSRKIFPEDEAEYEIDEKEFVNAWKEVLSSQIPIYEYIFEVDKEVYSDLFAEYIALITASLFYLDDTEEGDWYTFRDKQGDSYE